MLDALLSILLFIFSYISLLIGRLHPEGSAERMSSVVFSLILSTLGCFLIAKMAYVKWFA